jgi:hypothetical protein
MATTSINQHRVFANRLAESQIPNMSLDAGSLESFSFQFPVLNFPSNLLGRFFTRVFGCWHLDMGRPLTFGGET